MDVLLREGERRLLKRCGGVLKACTAFMLGTRKRSRRNAAGAWLVNGTAAAERLCGDVAGRRMKEVVLVMSGSVVL